MSAVETAVLRALADAADALDVAINATANEFVADRCDDALFAIKVAMRASIGVKPCEVVELHEKALSGRNR